MLETFAEVFIKAAQPRPAHATVDAVKRSGLGWIDELAAGLGHGRSLGVRALRCVALRCVALRCVGIGLGLELGQIYLRSGCPRFAIL